MWAEISERIDGSRSIDDLRGGSGERAIPVLVAIRDALGTSELALNIPNDDYISNLPRDVIVEVPAVVGADGPEGHRFGDLPSQIAAWCSNQVHVAELAVDAAVTSRRASVSEDGVYYLTNLLAERGRAPEQQAPDTFVDLQILA